MKAFYKKDWSKRAMTGSMTGALSNVWTVDRAALKLGKRHLLCSKGRVDNKVSYENGKIRKRRSVEE